jgi:hypothetical protein
MPTTIIFFLLRGRARVIIESISDVGCLLIDPVV